LKKTTATICLRFFKRILPNPLAGCFLIGKEKESNIFNGFRRVRAPLFPSPRLGSENSGTKPFFIGFDGKSEEESVGSNEVHLNTCRGKGRQVGGGSVATVWKY